ncbi:MAG TPA: hypothetical protein VFE38_03700 [Edaphobacter sp.]|nr:hypothetical protein [Edaphobacter sp.]
MKKFCSAILALVAVSGAIGNAQTLHVRLLNGSSGKPISNAYINVWVDDQRKEAIPISIDSNGDAILRLTGDATDKGVPAASANLPTFPYASEIKIQVGFALCQVKQQKYSWLQITPYSTEHWIRAGIMTANTCGKAIAKPEPGVLVIFVRPLNFWEKLSQ